MKILLVHYRYYEWGGPERYLFNVKKSLEAAGHEVVPFSVQHEHNQGTEFARFFAPAISGSGAKRFNEEALTPGVVWRKLERTFYSPSVESTLGRLIDETKPDLAYLLQFMRHLSPAVIVAAKRRNLPIVVRLSDYELVCPEAHLLRRGRVCEDCISSGSFWPSVRHACVNNSRLQSAVNALARGYHDANGYLDLIDRMVTPSRIVLNKMVEGGFDRERLTTIPTFVDTERFQPGPQKASRRKTIAYVGQLRPEKGVDLLLDAWSSVRADASRRDVRLVIAGAGPSDYVQKLQDQVAGDASVEFVGTLQADAVARLYQDARVTVIPSVWYENLPNSLLESYASGTPVVASAIGSLAEYITHRQTGWTFTAGDSGDLAAALREALEDDHIDAMSIRARQRAVDDHSAELHLNRLLSVFRELCAETAPGY